jgi:hypothetical protein
MVSANTGKGLGLIAGSESISPGFAGKDPIVAMVGRDIDTTLSGFGFELAFTGKGVSSPERYLMVDLDETRRGIVENSPPNVLGRGGFSAISVGESATNSRFVLINMNAVPRMELFFSKSVLVSGSRLLLFGFVRPPFRLGGLAG